MRSLVKRVISLGAIGCMVASVVTGCILPAVFTLMFASVSLGIMIGEITERADNDKKRR